MEQNGMYAEEYGENGYMEQEEEWEREGLLDPAWEKQQKKVTQKVKSKYPPKKIVLDDDRSSKKKKKIKLKENEDEKKNENLLTSRLCV